MKARLLACAVSAVMLAVGACSGKPVQLTAQAGSTIVIPLNIGAKADNALGLSRVGYEVDLPAGVAGFEYADPQRGRLVVELSDPQDPLKTPVAELLTRWVFLAEPPTASKLEQIRTWAGREVLIVADIPDDLGLEGLYGLEIRWKRWNPTTASEDVELALGEPYFGQITIIPSPLTIDHDDDPGTPDRTFTGTSTDFLYAPGGSGWSYISEGLNPAGAVPLPSFGIEIRETGAASHSSWLAYAEVEVDYPADTITIEDVVLSEPHRGRVWWVDQPQSNLLKVYTTLFVPFTNENGFVKSFVSDAMDLKASPLRVVFDLKDPATAILDLADVAPTLKRATDEAGNDLLVDAAWALTPASAIATEIQ
jgi:hypothetical protein